MNSDDKKSGQTRKNETLGQYIQECRQRNGWTQEELGWRTGITREHIGRIERDKCVPSVATLNELERALYLQELTLVRKLKAKAGMEVVYYDSEEKEMVGRACRELEHALAANLTTPNLLKASDAISTIAEVLNSNEQRLNEK